MALNLTASVINQPINELTRPPFLHLLKFCFAPNAKDSKIHTGEVWSEGPYLASAQFLLLRNHTGAFVFPGGGPSNKQFTQFLLLPLGMPTAQSQMSTPWSDLSASAWNKRLFIPPKHIPEGELSPGQIPLCFQSASHHV